MATIAFNVTTFRGMFSEFSDPIMYPDAVLQLYWDTATNYMTDQLQGSWYALQSGPQTLGLNQLTAHIASLTSTANSGDPSGIVSSATIDKVSVQVVPPPIKDQWEWWLNQTRYGAALLALLSIKAAGGFYFGGYPAHIAFRK